MKTLVKLQIIIYFIFPFLLGFGQRADTLKSYSNKALFEKANETYNKIYLFELSKRKILPEEEAKIYQTLGWMSINEGNYKEAENNFKRLLQFSENNDELKTSAYIGLSECTYMLGNSSDSFLYISKALDIINNMPTGILKFRRKFTTLSVYPLSGDFKTYERELNKLNFELKKYLNLSKNNDEKLKCERLQGKIYIELSDINIRLKKNTQAKKYIDSAKIALKNQPTKQFEIASIYLKYQEAYNFYHTGNYSASLEIFTKLLNDCEKYHINDYRFMAKVYLSKNYYQLRNYQKSLSFAESALQNKLPIPDYSENFETEALRYAFLSSSKMGNSEKTKKYEELFANKTKNLKDYERDQFVNSVLNKMNTQEAEQKSNQLKKILYFILAISLILAPVSFLYYKHKTKKNIEAFRQKFLLEKQTEKDSMADLPKVKKEKSTNIDEKTFIILEKLTEFENGKLFLEQNFSLSNLASYVNTNTITMSSIINIHKKSNFNDYVNGLRIDYIIEKMKNNPKYLNYKISYLAEESGFSSHSVFTIAFKKRAKITPSQFIKIISENTDN